MLNRSHVIISLTVILLGISLTLGPARAFALSSSFGVVGGIASLQGDGNKQTATNKIIGAGLGWTRQEFTYSANFDFSAYDAAYSKTKAAGLQTLGLLTYPSSGDHDAWKSYVQNVVNHYSDIPAWEIMNEADNYLSGSAYVDYLREARTIIKTINSNATIVASGITSRPQTPDFWNGINAAGGWDQFDVAALHVYHSGNPERVNFGGGDLLAEYDRAFSSLKKNGGGKKIWVTETGYKTSEVGNDGQANWLARTLILSKSVSGIDKIITYRLSDDAQATYGILGADLNPRPAYDKLKELVSYLGAAGTGTRLYPQTKQTLDSLENVNGWKTDATSNGTTSLSSVSGQTGNGMKISYHFNGDAAYAVAEKNLPISGTPQALAAWFYGDDTKNVWKYRFKDAKGETFQADLGNLSSGWTYKQFTIGSDVAYVSWDGDGKIDFPISFNSIVVDRQGGEADGSGIVDEIVSISQGADLFAYQFGNTVAYWKTSGETSAPLCGGTRTFNESPQYLTNASCNGETTKPVSASTTGVTAPASPKATPPKLAIDLKQSSIRVDGANIPADGVTTYRIVVVLKDTSGAFMKDQKPTAVVDGDATGVSIDTATLVGNEWFISVRSTSPGDKKLKVTAYSQTIGSPTLSFTSTASPVPSPLPSPSPAPVVVIPMKKSLSWLWYILAVLVGISFISTFYLIRFQPALLQTVRAKLLAFFKRNGQQS